MIKRYAKAITAVLALAVEAVQLGVVPSADQKWVSLGISVVTAVLVYAVPNAQVPAQEQAD